MAQAIAAVQNGLPFHTASKTFKVPRTTLKNKVAGKSPQERKMGPSTILTTKEEEKIVNWIKNTTRGGFLFVKDNLLTTVKTLVQKKCLKTPFTNGCPGRKWYLSFLKRHPEILNTVENNLQKMRRNVTEDNIRNWFREINEFFIEEDIENILHNGRRVFSADDCVFMLCPKTGVVLAPKGENHVIRVPEKEFMTIFLTVNGSGTIAPPMVVYPYVRLPTEIGRAFPNDWTIGKNDSGLMTGETFYEYMANVFLPWLNNSEIDLPIVFFVDGHCSYLTLQLSELCQQNKIILVALYPNSTHILEPCNYAFFKPINLNWKTVVKNFRMKHPETELTKIHFAEMMASEVKNLTPNIIINGFQHCGLVPFNPNAVDYSMCKSITGTFKSPHISGCTKKSSAEITSHLQFLEQHIPNYLMDEFHLAVEQGVACDRAPELFAVWHSIYLKQRELSILSPGLQSTINIHQPDILSINTLVPSTSSVAEPLCLLKYEPVSSNSSVDDSVFLSFHADQPVSYNLPKLELCHPTSSLDGSACLAFVVPKNEPTMFE